MRMKRLISALLCVAILMTMVPALATEETSASTETGTVIVADAGKTADAPEQDTTPEAGDTASETGDTAPETSDVPSETADTAPEMSDVPTETGDTAPETGGVPSETGDTAPETGDVPSETGDTAPETGDVPSETGDTAPETSDVPSETGDAAPETGDTAPETGDVPSETGDTAPEAGDVPSETVDTAPETSDVPSESVDTAPETGDVPSETGDAAPETGDTVPETGDVPSETVDTALETGDVPPETGDTPPETGDVSSETVDAAPETGDVAPETGDVPSETGDATTETGDTIPEPQAGADACAHDNVSKSESFRPDNAWTDKGDGTHSATGSLFMFNYCPDCQQSWNELLRENEERTEKHAFLDGKCNYCKAANTCAHDNITVSEYFQTNSAWTDNGDGTHSATGSRKRTSYCEDCREMWNETVAENLEQTDKHRFHDGKCQACGAANTCAHANAEESEYFQPNNDGWKDNGNGTHSAMGSQMKRYHCLDCDEYRYETLSENVSQTDKHSFYNGKCSACYVANTCAHANVEEHEYFMPNSDGWKDNGDGTHSAVGSQMKQSHCQDCNEYSHETLSENVSKTEEHSFNNGKCQLCGIANPCTHANVEEHEYFQPNSDGWKDNGNGTHSAMGSQMKQSHCQDCDEYSHETLSENVSKTEKHSFYNGKCQLCGVANPCAHDHVSKSKHFEFGPECTDNGNGTHTGVGSWMEYNQCEDCNEGWEETLSENESRTEAHSFYKGECRHCGSVNTCGHAHVNESEYLQPNSDGWKDNGNGTHSGTGRLMKHHYCEDCRENWDELLSQNESRTEEHSFYKGKCSYCGVANSCDHANGNINVFEYIKTENEWKDNGDGTHFGAGPLMKQYHCRDCQDTWEEVLKEYEERTEAHRFHEGKCSRCGVINPCKHDGGHVTETGSYMPEGEFTDNGNGTHTGVGSLVTEYFCRDCHEGWYKIISENEVLTESHRFDDMGTCVDCGYVCTHANMDPNQMYESRENVRFESFGAKGHYYVYDERLFTQCPDCHTRFEQDTVTEKKKADSHWFNKDGVCDDCGERNTCAHPYVMESRYYDTEDNHYATEYTEQFHSCYATLVEERECGMCGVCLSRTETPDQLLVERHWFENGYCPGCGYELANAAECTHLNKVTEEYWDVYGDDYEMIDEKTHEAHAPLYKITTCTDCGYEWDWELLEEDHCEVETHYFYHGVCNCGYVNECEHKSLVREESTENKHNAKALNAQQHTVVQDQCFYECCADCGEYLSCTYTGKNVTVTENHEFRNGECWICGYIEGAEATPSEPQPVTPPATEPEPAPEPEPEPAPAKKYPTAQKKEEDELFVPASDPESQPMVQTLIVAVQEAQKEGAQVTVEVVGAAEVMPEEEYTQMRELPVQEQLLVTLSSIGFDEVVEAASKAMNLTLSDEAQALRTQVNTRMSELTEEESEQLQKKLTQYFPVEEITANGVTYSYFVMELRIEVDGVARIERYGFRLDEESGEWIFVSLSTLEA